MLLTVQYLLMAIYCIKLSSQHKRYRMCMSVCQVGLRSNCPQEAHETAATTVCSKMCRTSMLYLRAAAAACTSTSVYVMCVPSVCTFFMLTGWLAAVLESLLTESVGSAGYFYPLACVREQVEALWATARSHGVGQH